MATQGTTHLATIAGANIRQARETADMTQHELATLLGTSVSRISGWERGLHLPGSRNRVGIADALFGGDESAIFREPERAAA